jgi:transcriptional regulator with XRE-family HTH domain
MSEETQNDRHTPMATEVQRPLVGAQIRRLRNERGLTLATVAKAGGLSVGYLSRVETDKVSPSLDTLALISNTLGVPITWLLVDSVPPPRVVRRKDRRRIDGLDDTTLPVTATASDTSASSGHIEVVDGSLSTAVRIVEIVLAPGVTPSLRAHAGEEHCIVLEGRLRFSQGGLDVETGPGDYVLWGGAFPHTVVNIGKKDARMLVVRYAAEGFPQP